MNSLYSYSYYTLSSHIYLVITDWLTSYKTVHVNVNARKNPVHFQIFQNAQLIEALKEYALQFAGKSEG